MDIAIVGIGCRFPGGADSPGKFWQLLGDGIDAVTEIPTERFDAGELFDPDPGTPGKLFSRWGGFVEDIDSFDAGFFGISPREAQRIDPQHRLLLEAAWEALEDGGLPADRLVGTRTGVFIGIATGDYGRMQLDSANQGNVDTYALLGTAGSVAANRISFHFDLRGPSMAVDTACSSSLVAVHLACRSLASGESDLVLTGGVNAFLAPEPVIGFCKAGMLSPDGRCRAFDAGANGYVRAEGVGVLVLKPLSAALADGDPIHAVIRSTATNQDGHTVGITVPRAEAQRDLMLAALAQAGLRPADVQYVEAHGTGTPVGDPLEARAIGEALASARPKSAPLLIGSVKTNIGHLEAAAGVAGLIKATLALEHRQIPPHLHLKEINPAIPLDELRLRIPTELEPWPSTTGPARAGVNSFGFGGANAHIVLEEPPPIEHDRSDDGTARLLTISARSEAALTDLVRRYRDRLRDDSLSLTDACYTAALRRTHHDHRLAVVATSRQECLDRLDEVLGGERPAGTASGTVSHGAPPKLAFVFTGMGPLWWGMGRQLMRTEPVYREAIEECDRLLRPLAPWSLLDELAAGEADSRVNEPDRAQVVNLAVHVALAALWRSWGIVPDAVVGHSAGELGAACVAGAITLPDALHIAYHRGRLQQRASGTGTMLAVGVSEVDAREVITGTDGELSLAAVNSPSSVTLSGAADALERIAAELEGRDVFTRFLPVAVPYHGPRMDPIRDELLRALAEISPRPASVPMVSVVTGDCVGGDQLDAGYWWRNVREPVRFADAVDTLAADGYTCFVEVGPHPVLTPSLRDCLSAGQRTATVLPTLRRQQDERPTMLASLAELYVQGRGVDWTGVFADGGRCVRLPTYAWQRERHWIEPPPASLATPHGVRTDHPLLGWRLHSAHRTWETELSDPQLSYLDGHALGETAVFPGAGFVEMALAAASGISDTRIAALSDFRFRALLALAPRDDVVVQTVHDAGQSAIEIHSTTADERSTWTLHATARLGRPAGVGDAVDLAAVLRRCGAALDVDEYYRSLADRGYRYGGMFRGISAIWRGEDEAIGRVEIPPGNSADADGYLVHPGLLDSAFQVLMAAMPGKKPGDVLVPVSMDRIEFHHRPGTQFWAHAHNGGDCTGRVRLLDDAGNVALTCDGVRLRPAGNRASDPAIMDDSTYEVRWRPGARDDGPRRVLAPSAVIGSALPAVRSLAADQNWEAHYVDVEPRLNAIAVHFARAALTELGWTGDVDAIDVVPEQRRYLAQLARIVRAAELDVDGPQDPAADLASAKALADRLWADHPADRAVIEVLRGSGERLVDVLRGRVDPREAMFAGDAVAALTAFYGGSGPLRHANSVLAEVFAAIGEQHGSPLRVLEVGAGTGGATAAVLPRLPLGSVEYTFTDVSPFFLASARSRFADRADMRFGVLDIESDVSGGGGYEVVLAADVLHATADLRVTLRNVRRLLRPGGTLVLLEVTSQTSMGDLIFGALDGWWRFTDTDLRPSYPLLDVAQWHTLLEETGFTQAHAVSDVFGGDYPLQAVLVAQASAEPALAVARQDWVIVGGTPAVAETVAAGLRARGEEATLLAAVPATVDDWTRLLAERPEGLLYLAALDAPVAERLTTMALMEHQVALCSGVAALVRAMQATGTYPELCLVTAGAHPVSDDDGPASIAQSALWGIGRVLLNEHPDLHCRLVELSKGCPPSDIDGLVEELAAEPDDTEVAFRDGQRHTRSLDALSADRTGPARSHLVSPDETDFRLVIGSPGALASARLEEAADTRVGPCDVVVRVRATALNFRDVLLALGIAPGAEDVTDNPAPLGFDCAGVVLACGSEVRRFRPGDEVVAICAGGALGSRLTVDEHRAVPKPAELSFAEAASIPGAFLTADYALRHAARIAPGERVLIHSASGGVGLAAVQVARLAGAEVFATAGSAEKRAYLHSIGLQHVFDSRSLVFADEIMECTDGEGVDVVLNALAGEAIRAGLSILRPYGRFVEIGKRDIFENTAIGMRPFQRNLSFCAFDLFQLSLERPALVERMLADTLDRIVRGDLSLLPIREFDLADAEDAFRFMAQARHIGKVVLTVDQPTYPVCARQDAPLVHPDATYLITGGLGGVGLALASWLVHCGAGTIVLLSRSGVPADADRDVLRDLRSSRANVVIERGDVSSEPDVTRVLDRIRRDLPPLRGVVHAAMVLDDGPLLDLDEERFERVLAPKVAGAWHLHQSTGADELDFFVLFSSLTSVIGTVMQGNYAAANAFLDGLASYRRALGLPGLAINWGPIGEVGYVARHPEISRFLAREGLLSLRPDEAFAVLEQSLRQSRSNTVAVRVDRAVRSDASALVGRYVETLNAADASGPDNAVDLVHRLSAAAPAERSALLVEHLARRAARVLATTVDRVGLDRPLPELGFDSLMAVELQTALKQDLGVQLAVTKLLEGTSIREIAALALDQLALAAPASVPAVPSVPAAAIAAEHDEPAHHPLSAEQRWFWLLNQLRPGDPGSIVHTAVRLSGALDLAALERALSEVVRRHDVLRARVLVVDGDPVQTFPAPAPVPLRVFDVPEDDLHRLAGEQLRQPFDLADGPLLRGVLFRLDHAEHVLVVTAHHIAFDPWCGRVLVGEITQLYADFRDGRTPTLPPPTEQYVDYVHRQRQRHTEDLLESQLAYWRGQLADVSATVELPADRPRPATPTHRGGHLPFRIDAAATDALTALSRSEGVTLFMTLLAGWLTVLHRCSRQDDMCVGTPVTTRGPIAGDDLVGCCVNTVVLRGDLAGDPTFSELLRRVRDVALAAYDHQDVPFDRVVEAVRPSRDGSMSPLFNTMLVLHGAPRQAAQLAGLRLSPVEIDSGLALFDLLLVLETGDELGGTLEFSTDLFEPDTAERLLGYFHQLLTSAATNPGQRLSELALLAASERDRAVQYRVPATVDLGPQCCAHELIGEQTARTPDAVAVVFEGAELTYQELDRRANQLAHRLRAEQIGPGSVVGVAVRRSSELVVAVLAVLKSGAAFLPLDADLPPTRLRWLIADARARVVLASRPLPVDATTIVVGESGDTEVIGDSGAPAPSVTPDDPAYVIYTSGSTGTPKAVAVPHRAIVNQLRWRQATFPLTGEDAVLQRTPVGFDPAVWELLGPLMAGATVVMPRPGSDHDGAYLASLITEREVTTLQVVPSLLEALLTEPAFACCHTLRRVFCGGEMLTPALVERFFGTLSAELHNLYGPTETAIDATHWVCAPGGELPVVPIGRPIANVSVSVLDERRQPVPVGIPGELYIGGAGVALGYLNHPALTAERFLPDPFRQGSRMYRTGDIGRLRADGAIEFLGRADQQLKVRGMRVEPAEVEAVLTGHPTVTEAAVVAQDGRLVAFVVSADEATTDTAALARFAGDRLPPHLVPDEFAWLPALPRTASAKVDRSQLARTRIEPGTSKALVAPRDTTELRLVRLWEEELKTGPIGVTDDFFALGGHSLLAMRLAARIHQELGCELPVAALVQERTVAGVARLLAGQPAPDGPLVRIQPRGTRPPLFCVHPVSGSVFDYVELAAALGDDQPCYALQARDSAPHTRIEDMARDYVDAVRSVRSTGPYLLGGWSMGGMVAFEMARQLSAAGKQVGLLAMLDVWPAGADIESTEHDDVMLAGLARELGLPPDVLTSAVREMWQLDEHEQLAYVRQQVRRADVGQPGVDLDELGEHRWEVFLANARAMRAYQPRRYPGRITVITASEPLGAGGDAAAQWAAFTPDGPELHTTPGDHYTMLRAPHVHTLAATLRELLDKAVSQ